MSRKAGNRVPTSNPIPTASNKRPKKREVDKLRPDAGDVGQTEVESVQSVGDPKVPGESNLSIGGLEARVAAVERREAELKTREDELLKRMARHEAELRNPTFPKNIHRLVRSAPSPWHLQVLTIEAIKRLRYACQHGNEESKSSEDWLADPHYALARITAQLNKALTAKSTPSWLLKLKAHPAFKHGWKLQQRTKGSHSGKELERVIEIPYRNGDTMKAEFHQSFVLFQRMRDGKVIDTFEKERVPSQTVLSTWVGGILREFDESLDYGSSPLSSDWATRWRDEDKYIEHFIPFAEQSWDLDAIDELQVLGIWGPGLLTTNNGRKGGKPRSDFAAFVTRIERLARHQLRVWRDSISGPALKVLQE